MKLPNFLKKRVATESAQSGPSIRVPYTSPGLGAKYGEPITDTDRTFAIKREPVAHRIVFSVAHDIFDNWFDAEDTAEKPDENFDQAIQAALSELNAKDVFTPIYLLLALVALEIAHLTMLWSRNSEVFAAITDLAGTIFGVLLERKG